MIKRILEILVFPFHLIYLILSLPFKLSYIIFNDRKEKSKRNRREPEPILVDHSIRTRGNELLDIGKLLFSGHKDEFQIFFNLYLTDKNKFLSDYQGILSEYNNFDFEQIEAIEVIYIYGATKRLLMHIDWRGEENIGEIEEFLKTELQIKADWNHAKLLRKSVEVEKQRDGYFVKSLLRSVELDLKSLNKRLIFLNLGWDAYVCTVADEIVFKTIHTRCKTLFYGIGRL